LSLPAEVRLIRLPERVAAREREEIMAGYPRVIGYHPGIGYVAGGGYVVGAEPPVGLAVHPAPAPAVHSAPWRPMMAPGSPPLGEGHVPMPLTAETFGGAWTASGGTGAPPGTLITFSARPQKPYKAARLIASGTKSGTTAIGRLIAQIFVGTSLQQAELGFFDLESIGAATAFDTWVSLHQAEPGVWIRVQGQLTAYPTGTDFETYVITALGHYLQ
jgi:hypothetical protein